VFEFSLLSHILSYVFIVTGMVLLRRPIVFWRPCDINISSPLIEGFLGHFPLVGVMFVLVSVDWWPVDLFQTVFPSGVIVTKSGKAETPLIVYHWLVIFLKSNFAVILLTLDVIQITFLSCLTVDSETLFGISKHGLCLIWDVFVASLVSVIHESRGSHVSLEWRSKSFGCL
jgi:hypothetical protein